VPGIVFHFLNNAFAVSAPRLIHAPWAAHIIPWIYRNPEQELYHGLWIVASVLSSGLMLFKLWKMEPDRAGRAAPSEAVPVAPVY